MHVDLSHILIKFYVFNNCDKNSPVYFVSLYVAVVKNRTAALNEDRLYPLGGRQEIKRYVDMLINIGIRFFYDVVSDLAI